jgi:hypothetical protein
VEAIDPKTAAVKQVPNNVLIFENFICNLLRDEVVPGVKTQYEV